MINNKRLAEKLLNKQERIEDAKVSKNREEGKQEGQYKQLQDVFKCKSLKAVDKELQEIDRDITKGQRALDKGATALEDNYPW